VNTLRYKSDEEPQLLRYSLESLGVLVQRINAKRDLVHGRRPIHCFGETTEGMRGCRRDINSPVFHLVQCVLSRAGVREPLFVFRLHALQSVDGIGSHIVRRLVMG